MEDQAEGTPVSGKKRWPRVAGIVMAAAVVVAGAVGAGFAFGHRTNGSVAAAPRTTTTTVTVPSPPSTDSPAPPTTTPTAVVGTPVSLSDNSGNAVQATLVQVGNDGADADTFPRSCLSGQDDALVFVELSLTNNGSSVLTSGDDFGTSIGDGTTLVDASSVPYQVNHCDSFSNSTDAAALCAGSSTSIDLSPGDSATVCPVFIIPATTDLNEVQFDASNAFDGFGSGLSVAVWHLNQS
jgi:hypothetical protein